MAQGKPITEKQKAAFIAALRTNANVTLAAEAASVSRVAMYDLRKADPAFAAAWADAEAEGADRLEAEAWRRAVEGTEEPVIGRVEKDRDGVVTYVRKYSDSLTALLLKAHKPEKYRERQDVKHSGEVAVKGYMHVSPDDWDQPEEEADTRADSA